MPQNNQVGFDAHDAERFRKLVALFDSNQPGEVDTAFRKALFLCAERQMRFSDALAETFGLAGMQERLDERERQAEQLADALDNAQQEFADYRQKAEAEIEKLRRNPPRRQNVPSNAAGGAYCRGCEWKRRILAVIAAGPIAGVWFSHFEWSSAEPLQNLFGILLSACPLLVVLLRWRWLLFKQKYSWVSRRDNDIYRAIAARWNGFLERLAMN